MCIVLVSSSQIFIIDLIYDVQQVIAIKIKQIQVWMYVVADMLVKTVHSYFS